MCGGEIVDLEKVSVCVCAAIVACGSGEIERESPVHTLDHTTP